MTKLPLVLFLGLSILVATVIGGKKGGGKAKGPAVCSDKDKAAFRACLKRGKNLNINYF